MHRGLPCSKGMLVFTVFGICCSPSTSNATSYSYGKTPTMMRPTCNDMHTLLINKFDSRIKGNISKIDATSLFDIFPV
jgi:hypothetical protein